MKTSNDSRFRRPVGSRLSVRTVAWLVLLAMLLAAACIWRGPFGDVLNRPLASLPGMRGGIGAWVGSVFVSKGTLAASNAALSAQLAHAQALLADRDALAAENASLKAMLGRTDASGATVLAGVIARPPAVPYDTLLIDAGARQDIRGGDTVIAGGGAAIGTVVDVYASSARVALFSSPGTEYRGLLRIGSAGAESPIEVPIAGDGGGSFSGVVPASTPVSVGDELLLPGIVGGVMGSVVGIATAQGDSFKTLYFRLPANFFELQYVEIRKSDE